MGLLDGLVGGVMQGMAGGSAPGGADNPLLQAALALLQQNGGLQGVVDLFTKQGLGAQAASWVSTGQNQAISPEQIQQVLGGAGLGDLAAKLGLSQGEAGAGLAQALPDLINRMTPNGSIPADSDQLLSQGMQALGKLFG